MGGPTVLAALRGGSSPPNDGWGGDLVGRGDDRCAAGRSRLKSAIEQRLEPLWHDPPLEPHERGFEVGHPLEGGSGLIDRD